MRENCSTVNRVNLRYRYIRHTETIFAEMPLSHAYDGVGLFTDKLPVVLEIGNLFTKAGFAQESSPRCIIPSSLETAENQARYLSDFKNEDDLYHILVEFIRNLYSRYLLVNPKERHIVIVEPVFARTAWRSTLAKVLYTHFDIPYILWLPNQLAAVNAVGSHTALVVDFGRDEISVIPVIHGCTLLNHIQTIGLGAKAFDENLKSLLPKYCTDLSSEKLLELISMDILQNLRIHACFVGTFNRATTSVKPENEGRALKPFQYRVDGSHIISFDGSLREKPAEMWFQNDDPDGESLPVVILETLKRLPIDNRKLLASSILLTGSLSQIPGLKSRLVRELNNLAKINSNYGNYEIKFFDPPCSEGYLAWLGGSHCASVDYITHQGLSREAFLKTNEVPDWCSLKSHSDEKSCKEW